MSTLKDQLRKSVNNLKERRVEQLKKIEEKIQEHSKEQKPSGT